MPKVPRRETSTVNIGRPRVQEESLAAPVDNTINKAREAFNRGFDLLRKVDNSNKRSNALYDYETKKSKIMAEFEKEKSTGPEAVEKYVTKLKDASDNSLNYITDMNDLALFSADMQQNFVADSVKLFQTNQKKIVVEAKNAFVRDISTYNNKVIDIQNQEELKNIIDKRKIKAQEAKDEHLLTESEYETLVVKGKNELLLKKIMTDAENIDEAAIIQRIDDGFYGIDDDYKKNARTSVTQIAKAKRAKDDLNILKAQTITEAQVTDIINEEGLSLSAQARLLDEYKDGISDNYYKSKMGVIMSDKKYRESTNYESYEGLIRTIRDAMLSEYKKENGRDDIKQFFNERRGWLEKIDSLRAKGELTSTDYKNLLATFGTQKMEEMTTDKAIKAGGKFGTGTYDDVEYAFDYIETKLDNKAEIGLAIRSYINEYEIKDYKDTEHREKARMFLDRTIRNIQNKSFKSIAEAEGRRMGEEAKDLEGIR